MKKSSALAYGNWKKLLIDAFHSYPAIWWRISAISVLTMIMIFAGTAIFLQIGLFFFKESFENFMANLQYGGSIISFTSVLFLLVLWALFVVTFSINGKIGNLITMRNYVHNKKQNPFNIYFKEAWTYFWRYVVTGLQMLYYILWPVALVLVVVFAITYFLPIELISTIGFFLSAVLFIWRGLKVFLSQLLLVEFNKDPKKSIEGSIKAVQGNWWSVLLFLLGCFFLISLVRVLFIGPAMIWEEIETLVSILATVDFLFSFFVLAPLLISFMYLFMLHLTKLKNIK
ncbi:hypothetical protein K9M41_02045 [Candidatus Gracilibacteria bacterium]|nr:hypothetical protein [Candidatus Gracilibacteria bacterium]